LSREVPLAELVGEPLGWVAGLSPVQAAVSITAVATTAAMVIVRRVLCCVVIKETL
jgi:hypothetical protein